MFLGALATAYQAGKRSDDALKTWQKLYDTATSSGFVLAAAEASHAMADLYDARKEYDKAISNYSLAAEAWAHTGNQGLRIAALDSERVALFRQGRKTEALLLNETLLPLAKASNNSGLRFIIDVSIAEILDGSETLAGV